MDKITINNIEYEVISTNEDSIDTTLLSTKITEYYNNFDYIVGDWAYGKVRLKGFYDSNNPNCKPLNDISTLNNYIENNCAYGCKWFELKRINKK